MSVFAMHLTRLVSPDKEGESSTSRKAVSSASLLADLRASPFHCHRRFNGKQEGRRPKRLAMASSADTVCATLSSRRLICQEVPRQTGQGTGNHDGASTRCQQPRTKRPPPFGLGSIVQYPVGHGSAWQPQRVPVADLNHRSRGKKGKTKPTKADLCPERAHQQTCTSNNDRPEAMQRSPPSLPMSKCHRIQTLCASAPLQTKASVQLRRKRYV